MKSSLNDRNISFGHGPRTPNLVKSKFTPLGLIHIVVLLENFDKFPEPGAYKLPSDFERRDQGKMFSFGASRDAYDRVYYPERIPNDRALPGPGHYNQESKTISKNNNLSFTMLSRIPTESHIAVK